MIGALPTALKRTTTVVQRGQGATREGGRRGAYGRDRWVDEHALVRNRTRERLRRTFVGILLLVGVKGILSLLHDVPSAERGPC